MKNITFKTEWFAWGIILASIGLSIIWYPDLPGRVPSHWNIAGEIDGWTTPSGHIGIMLGIMIGMYFLLTFLPFIDPRKENVMKSAGFIALIKNYLLAFFFIIYSTISYTTIQGTVAQIERIVPIAIGILFVLIGNYLNQVKSNYFVGIRTPWTLHSEDIWRKTHHIGGILFVLSGVIFIGGSFLPVPYNFSLPMGGVAVATLVPILYSYWLFRNKK